MTAFEIYINQERCTVAGVSKGVISAILHFANRDNGVELALNVGGLEEPAANVRQHLDWVNKALTNGDEIRIRIVTVEQSDPPASIRVEDPAEDLKRKKEYLERLKLELGDQIQG